MLSVVPMPYCLCPMISRPIHSCRTLLLPELINADILTPLKSAVPGSARRMTLMGLIVSWLTKDLTLSPDVAVIYATQYSEVDALERYLSGFPSLSPLLFQTSIHPSAIQQVWIARKSELESLYPISGDAHIVASALQNALLCSADRILIIGGEEQANWLHKHNIGSPKAFGFCLELGALGATGGMAVIERHEKNIGATPSLNSFCKCLSAKEDLRIADPNGGHYQLRWTSSETA